MLDGELRGRTPAEGPHREVVGASVVDSELLCKVIQGIKAVAGIKPFLVFPVTVFHLAVVAGCIGADKLVTDSQLGGRDFKERGQIPLAVGKTIGKLKAIVRLDAFHLDAPAGIPLEQPFQKISRSVGCLVRVGRQKAQPMPQFHHAKVGIAAAHVPDQFQLRCCVLVRMAVWPPGPAGQGLHCSVPADLQK